MPSVDSATMGSVYVNITRIEQQTQTESKHEHAHARIVWDTKVTPFDLPPGLVLVLGDVKGGAKTPDMVKKVLQWKDTAAGLSLLLCSVVACLLFSFVWCCDVLQMRLRCGRNSPLQTRKLSRCCVG